MKEYLRIEDTHHLLIIVLCDYPKVAVHAVHRRRGSWQTREKSQSGDPETLTDGAKSDSDTGLYISTGEYTKETRYEGDRASVPVTLLDLDCFARTLIDHYDDMDAETRAILPLVRIYWPA